MKKERVKTKRGFKGVGTFILGWFIGFISTLGILVGIGYWAYSSISIKKIEKWTKNDITSNSGLEDLTLKKVVAIAQGITKTNKDAYTIAKLEEDFNIKVLDDSIYGISLDTIRNAPMGDIKKAFDETIDSITFNNILSFINVDEDELGLLNTILQTEVIYYVRNGVLYATYNSSLGEYADEADFNYTVEGDVVKFASGTHTIASGSIKLRISDLPLTTALDKMTNATMDLKIYQILDYERTGVAGNYTYIKNGKEMSGIMASLAEYTINDLADQERLNNIYVYEVLGYKNLGDGEYSYINSSKQEVEVVGAMKVLAGKKIGDLSDPDLINNLHIWEVMGYYYNLADQKYYEDQNYSILVEGVMSTIAGKTIGELDDAGAFNDVTIADAMGYTIIDDTVYDSKGDKVEGLFVHIADTKVSQLSSKINTLTVGQVLDIQDGDNVSGIIKALKNVSIKNLSSEDTINNIYIYQVMDYTSKGNGVYTYIDENGDEVEVDGVMKAIAGKKVGELDSKTSGIYSLTLSEVLGVDTTATSTPAIIKALATSTLGSLNDDIARLQVYKVMGYYEHEGKYYHNYNAETQTYENEVTGIMGAIASSNVNNIGGTIDGLTAVQVLGEDCKILNIIKTRDKNTVKITELATVLPEEINNASIDDLVKNKIITGVDTENAKYQLFKDFTIAEIINIVLK